MQLPNEQQGVQQVQQQGLLQQGGQPQGQPQPAPQGQPKYMDTRDYQKEPPTQEDQKQIEMASVDAVRMLHADKTRDKVIDMMKKSDHPIDGLANVAVKVLQRLEQQANKEKRPMNDFIRTATGTVIVGELLDMAKKSGVMDLDENGQKVALAQTVQEYMKQEISSGRRDPNAMQQQVSQGMESYAGDLESAQMAEERGPKTMAERLGAGGLL